MPPLILIFKTGKGNFSLSLSALNTELFFLYFETTKYSSSKFIFISSYNLVPTFGLFSMCLHFVFILNVWSTKQTSFMAGMVNAGTLYSGLSHCQ